MVVIGGYGQILTAACRHLGIDEAKLASETKVWSPFSKPL